MANASHKGMGLGNKEGHQTAGQADLDAIDEHSLSDDLAAGSERQAAAGEILQTEGVLESFEKTEEQSGNG